MDESPNHQRAKRQKIDKSGRFAALNRLKHLKGSKNKYEVEEMVDNVYDEVDEKEYAQRVLSRAKDDWIDDDGTGYVEDGREIFDEEDSLEANSISSKKDKKKGNHKRLRDINVEKQGQRSIQSLLKNIAPKKAESNLKLEDDNILANILGEIREPSKNKALEVNSCKHVDVDIAKNYMKTFTSNFVKKPDAESTVSSQNDDIILKRIFSSANKTTNCESDKSIKDIISKVETPSELTRITRHSLEQRENDHKLSIEHVEGGNDCINVSLKRTLDHNQPEINIEEKITETELVSYNNMFDDADFQFENVNVSYENPEIQTPKSSEHTDFQFEKEKVLHEGDKPEVESAKSSEHPDFQNLIMNWEQICNNASVISDNVELSTENSNTDKIHDIKDDLKLWFWDAWEDPYKRPGHLFLFGKIAMDNSKDFSSIAVHVENVERVLYLLPREYRLDPETKSPTSHKVTMADVYHEFNESIAKALRLETFRSKTVEKNLAFTIQGVVDVPEISEYLEVRYDGRKPTPDHKRWYNSIAHIFGLHTNPLETFLLERKIKGPCWLNCTNFNWVDRPLSYCKYEIICTKPISIRLVDEPTTSPPPMVLAALNVRTALNQKTLMNEVVMISILVNERYYLDQKISNPPFQRCFCGVSRPVNVCWPPDLISKLSQYKVVRTTKHDSERALLSWFLANMQIIDPDLIVSHDIYDCQLDVICDRITNLKIQMWSKIGRLRMSDLPVKRGRPKDFLIGRMVCDVKHSAEELIAKARSYDLQTLCTNYLKIKDSERIEVSNELLFQLYETSDGILKLITLTMQDCLFVIRLMCELNVIPLALQITNICGNLMSRTLLGGRSERNEFLLLHAFTEKNFIVPDKSVRGNNNVTEFGDDISIAATQGANNKKKGAAYAGGLVLDPIKGFYDKFILLMDFNSLYPSIIQEYNICFTTVNEPSGTGTEDIALLPDPTVEQGILPRQIRRLVESRRQVKKLMADEDVSSELYTQYNIRQLALKLTANSMYGCLGFSNSRFYAPHLAALVTHKGREILVNTKSLVQKLNYEVVYGDTDSIMINTNITDYEQVYKVGHTIKQAVNKIYSQVELDIDGVFKYLLLLKKKKYAGLLIAKPKNSDFVYKRELKGLDIVRRDWSKISVIAGELIINELFMDVPMDDRICSIHTHLERIAKEIVEEIVPLELLVITKQLTKHPKDYTNDKQYPHVQVALRMNRTKNKRYKRGDMVDYIICEDGTNNGAMQRAYHLDELKVEENLKVDTNYYLAFQIHPVVSRLCEPIDGTDAGRIASCLGLDPTKYKTAAQRAQRERLEDTAGEVAVKSFADKYRACEKFQFICMACKTPNLMASAVKRVDTRYQFVLEKCENLECSTAPYTYASAIRNQVVLAIRSYIQRFYANWLVCDNPDCNENTRKFSHVKRNNRPLCLKCKSGSLVRQYSEEDLHSQLCYFQYCFDLTVHHSKALHIIPEIDAAHQLIKEGVDRFLIMSSYAVIKLSNIFAYLPPIITWDTEYGPGEINKSVNN